VNPDRKAWLRVFTAAPGAPRLFCLPHAGGVASGYLSLSRALAPRVEVVAVQYPGRHERFAEPPAESVEELADAVAALMDDEAALFGHSMGALVAFEVARRRPVRHLFVSGAVPPPYFRLSDRLVRENSSDSALIEEILGYGGTHAELLDDEAMRELILGPLRADYGALVRYRPQEARVAVPLTVLIGASDSRTTPETAAKWAEQTTAGPIEQHVLPGGHFFHHDQPLEIAGIIAKTLGRHPADDAGS
jgi:surfactin synthase thioesterase subunit